MVPIIKIYLIIHQKTESKIFSPQNSFLNISHFIHHKNVLEFLSPLSFKNWLFNITHPIHHKVESKRYPPQILLKWLSFKLLYSPENCLCFEIIFTLFTTILIKNIFTTKIVFKYFSLYLPQNCFWKFSQTFPPKIDYQIFLTLFTTKKNRKIFTGKKFENISHPIHQKTKFRIFSHYHRTKSKIFSPQNSFQHNFYFILLFTIILLLGMILPYSFKNWLWNILFISRTVFIFPQKWFQTAFSSQVFVTKFFVTSFKNSSILTIITIHKNKS